MIFHLKKMIKLLLDGLILIRRSLVSEATALPIEPQPLPEINQVFGTDCMQPKLVNYCLNGLHKTIRFISFYILLFLCMYAQPWIHKGVRNHFMQCSAYLCGTKYVSLWELCLILFVKNVAFTTRSRELYVNENWLKG